MNTSNKGFEEWKKKYGVMLPPSFDDLEQAYNAGFNICKDAAEKIVREADCYVCEAMADEIKEIKQ